MVKEIKPSPDKSKGSKKFIGLPPLPAGQYEAYIPYSGWRAQGRFRHKLRQETILRKEAVRSFAVFMVLYFLITELIKSNIFGHSSGFWINVAFYGYLFIMMYPLVVAPSNIQIGKDGIRLHWVSFLGLLSTPWISWNSISLVSVTDFSRHYYKSKAIEFNINRAGLPLSLLLLLPLLKPYFSFSAINLSQPLKLSFDINAITHEADLPILLRTTKNMLPVENLADEVLALEEAKGQTFTKLWLDSLQGEAGDRLRLALTPLEQGDSVLAGQYEIVSRLAAGGQAVTYLAQTKPVQEDLQEQSADDLSRARSEKVVLKEFVLPVRGGMEIRKRALENVEHEAKLLQKLNNERIVKLIDCFVDSQRAYLVLEYIDGLSLRKLVQDGGAVSENEAVRLGIEMCRVLEYLHTLEPAIIHRDFTPENLLLRSTGSLALIDFNVAEQLESKETKTMVGKHCYVSPEQFRGKATIQSDIYACGCSLYWLLTGQDPEPISMSHPKTERPELSDEINTIVACATAIDVSKRFASAALMRAALEKIT